MSQFDFYGAIICFSLMVPGNVFAYRVICLNKRKRTHAIQVVAKGLGLQFASHGNDTLFGLVMASPLGAVGQSHRLTNLIHGKIGHTQVAVFDFEYREGKATPRHTVVRLHWRGTTLPGFTIGPRNWITRDLFESLAGRDDIHFASDSTFSSNYFLRGSNAKAIRRLFTGFVRNFYEEHLGLTTEVSGNRLHYYRAFVRVAPDDIQAFLNEALQLLALLQPANDKRNS